VDDTRETPSLPIITALREAAVEVAVHDPLVQKGQVELSGFDACVRGADCLLLLTDHDEYRRLDPNEIGLLMRSRTLYDTRNMLEHAAWRNAGFHIQVLGAGSPPHL